MSEFLDNVRKRIETLGMNFQFKEIIKTYMNGIEHETWLLEYEDSQFVFVSGKKNVTLGWNIGSCHLGNGVLEGLREEFDSGYKYYQDVTEDISEYLQNEIKNAMSENDLVKANELQSQLAEELENLEETINNGGYSNWENFMLKWNENLSNCLSPLRTADISDMIVETDSRYLEHDEPSLEQAVYSLKKGPFTLANEDEWEYLCNGGTRTLFRWGDTLNKVIKEIYEIGTDSSVEENSILEQPNMFGLFIAYNSYKNEIIDSTLFTKGGDVGCSLCGGDGAIYVLPCYTAFYRNPIQQKRILSKDYYSYRRIIRLP